MNQMLVPVIPESAPFTPEQRAYLNGFLAGMFSRGISPGPVEPPNGNTRLLQPLSILFGSQTGNAEKLAKRIVKEAGNYGFAATPHDLARYPLSQLAGEKHLLVVTSTFGDGEPPDNARGFWEALNRENAPRLQATRFSILALGDTNYPKFCQFGKVIDQRLEALGGHRVHPRQDCDVDYEKAFANWLSGVMPALAAAEDGRVRPSQGLVSSEELATPKARSVDDEAVYSRKNPFPARLLANRRLSGPGSAKEVRHVELSLEGSGLTYEVGDALGVAPANCPELVSEILAALGCDGEEGVTGKDGQLVSLRFALLRQFEITRIHPQVLVAIAERSGDAELKRLALPGANGELTKFLLGREIIDLLLAHPQAEFEPQEFVDVLRKLPPRLYSISSSPKAHPDQVHLTVGVVRFESFGRPRKGVCSTFLAERISAEDPVPVFVHMNKSFRPPPPEAPLIMVGPGTGIAPFRAFLEERRISGANGRNWLFFGDQHAAADFLYRDELDGFLREGTLTRLESAFSRDQEKKIYVQHRMLEHAKELYTWIESGGHFYVCGDASRMAKDVDAALHHVIVTASGRTSDEAAAYVRQLTSERRYQRDVY